MLLDKCLVCGASNFIVCIDLGEQYISSIFPDSLDYKSKHAKYPLRLKRCQGCGFLQLDEQPDMTAMYKQYPYTSSSNQAMKKELQDVANSGHRYVEPGDVILDIGGNDGTLLSFFNEYHYELINIDAAENIKPISTGFKNIKGLFSSVLFKINSEKQAKLIFSTAMFYHLLDPVNFSKEVANCLDDNGVWIIQMAYLPTMLQTNMYDNIVHEHVGYYTLKTLQGVLTQAGLEIFDVELNDVYGGSFRVFIQKKGSYIFTTKFYDLIEQEMYFRISELKTYIEFNKKIEDTKNDLRTLLIDLKRDNKRVWVYGASTKGNTILQYCGVDNSLIEAAAEVNPFKFGKYMIGSDIPIKSEEEMHKAMPDYLLILPYGFVQSFRAREPDIKFIIPLPEVAICEPKAERFVISIGELIDRISILNVKIWHTEEAVSQAKNDKDMNKVADLALMLRALNRERASLREEINVSIEGASRGSTKVNYVDLGRDKL